MFQRILVPLDGSQHAERAIPVAAHIARACDGTLILVRVIDIQSRIAWQAPDLPIDFDSLLKTEQETVSSYLTKMAQADELTGLKVITEVVVGEKPGEAILYAAQEQSADLIIISSHGYTGFKKLVLGSVAQQIERHSHVPVLILRDETNLPAQFLQESGHPVRVIVPLDGHPQAEQILPAAADLSMILSAPARGAIHLALIIPGTNQHEMVSIREYNQAQREARAYLNSVIQRLRQNERIAQHLVIASSVSQRSSIADGLVAFAAKGADPEGTGGYDMIAMATHGREGLDRLLHTSITEQVLDATRVPALIIKSE